ncbi:MAG: hypothetical protein HQK54_08900 [Oligoflexales bacterium]|nr:hypothetical protein [Oligoflexales bacterium]
MIKIVKLIMKRESALEQIYRELAASAPTKSLRQAYHWLACEESRHSKELLDLADGEIVEKVEIDSKSALREISLRKNLRKIERSQLSIYKKARHYENESLYFYKLLLLKSKTRELREFLLKIIEEEQKHFELMDLIVRQLTIGDTFSQRLSKSDVFIPAISASR